MIGILVLLFWFGCGVLSAGFFMASSQAILREYYTRSIWRNDWYYCIFFIVLGPMSLLGVLLAGAGRNGWTLRYRILHER